MRGRKGRLIVFEGVDAAGKTTLCDDLCEALKKRDLPVRRYHFPGKTPGTLGELVYRIHHDHADGFGVPTLHPCSLQLLHIAAHVDVIETSIKQDISGGSWAVLDRFWWSTYVYGLDAGVEEDALRSMIDVEIQAWRDVQPEPMFLIDSMMPLREDESGTAAWQRKRTLYARFAESQASAHSCVRIRTERSAESRANANSAILRAVLTESDE